ncbi:MAG: LOG family protein [Candidatus Angelobacter sp.]
MARFKRHVVMLLRVVWDFIQGIYGFHLIERCVTVFGSARLNNQSPEYAAAYNVGMVLGKNGHTVMTGGGPGLMEAASRGARESGGRSIACRIRLSFEQNRNNYIDRSVSFRYFFVRKVRLVRNSYALVILPGGLGTLDELFEVLTLIQSRKIPPLPIVLDRARILDAFAQCCSANGHGGHHSRGRDGPRSQANAGDGLFRRDDRPP